MPDTSSPPKLKPMPTHVGIIMDGNGRWAQARNLPRREGHRAGVENVRKIVQTAKELDIRYLTLYAFSVENWRRPKAEVEALMWLLQHFLENQSNELIEKEIRLQVIGSMDPLPKAIRKLLDHTMERTASFKNWTLSLALNYGSRDETLNAVKRLLRKAAEAPIDPETITWEFFAENLYTANMPDPDLIIRTSGEQRLSNFLLLQSAYAEYIFAPEFWPDFAPEAFRRAIEQYRSRERRFGLTQEQLLARSL